MLYAVGVLNQGPLDDLEVMVLVRRPLFGIDYADTDPASPLSLFEGGFPVFWIVGAVELVQSLPVPLACVDSVEGDA